MGNGIEHPAQGFQALPGVFQNPPSGAAKARFRLQAPKIPVRLGQKLSSGAPEATALPFQTLAGEAQLLARMGQAGGEAPHQVTALAQQVAQGIAQTLGAVIQALAQFLQDALRLR